MSTHGCVIEHSAEVICKSDDFRFCDQQGLMIFTCHKKYVIVSLNGLVLKTDEDIASAFGDLYLAGGTTSFTLKVQRYVTGASTIVTFNYVIDT